MKQFIYIGTYTESILFGTGETFKGKGKGLSVCEFKDGHLIEYNCVALRNPSFVCVNEKAGKLYAVNEIKEHMGTFGGTLTQLCYDSELNFFVESEYSTKGTDPCHVIVAPDRSFVAVANYSSGSLTIFPLDTEGNIKGEKQFFKYSGNGVCPIRQEKPHAHGTVFCPDGERMYVVDLGTDMLRAYIYSKGKVVPDPKADVHIEPGSGPRFGVFAPNKKHFYLICEISSQIMHFTYEKGKMVYREAVCTLPNDASERNLCADVHITPDGAYLYASNRGHDSISCFKVEKDGSLSFLRCHSCGGKTPRNFAIDPEGRFVLVANQDSDNIVVFEIKEEGVLEVKSIQHWNSPVCLCFF